MSLLTNSFFLPVLSVLCIVWFIISFDKLVKFEHTNFFEQWLSDGQPTGEFWRATESYPSARSNIASLILMFGWLFDTPAWAKSNEEAKKLFRRYRISAVLVASVVFLLMYFDVWLGGKP